MQTWMHGNYIGKVQTDSLYQGLQGFYIKLCYMPYPLIQLKEAIFWVFSVITTPFLN